MTTTTAPPPKLNSSRPFIIAVLLMLLVIGGVVIWKMGAEDDPPREPEPAAAPVATMPIPDQVLPPPPPIATEDAAAPPPEPTRKVVASQTFCSSCGKCTGTEAANFRSVVRGRAGTAQRCYEKALAQQEGLQGKLTVNLCVGVGGGVCGASVASDSLGSPLVSQCVLNIFRASTFPSPKNGCVDAQVPLNFVPQKP